MSLLFDTHAHYDDEQFQTDRKILLASLPENGVEGVVNVGASIDSSKRSIELAKEYDFIYAAVGVHPDKVGELDENQIEWLEKAAKEEKVVAIGEIGLDYYWNKEEKEIQKKWFVRQLQLAKQVSLPVIIHSREAAADTWDILKAEKISEMRGVIHCYSYSKEMAKNYFNHGFFLGIGGVLTFANAKKLKEVVEYAPLEQIVLETDCPYLAPIPFRGKRNESTYLAYVAEEISRIKQVSVEMVKAVTNQNAKTLYGLWKENGEKEWQH